MNVQIKIQDSAQRALTRFYKDDPQGTELVIDSINLLRGNPHQGGEVGRIPPRACRRVSRPVPGHRR